MANLIAAVTDVTVTPAAFLPGESLEITCTVAAGGTALTGFECALYGAADGVNCLATPLLSKSVSIAANAAQTVTIQATACALDAMPDGRKTAFAHAADNGLRGLRLSLGFRAVSAGNGGESAGAGSFMYETPDVAGAFNLRCVPAIDALRIERASYDAAANVFRPDDEGVRALLTCKVSAQDATWVNGFACTLTWGANTALVCASRAGSVHNRETGRWVYGNAALLEGLNRSIWPLYDWEFDAGDDYVMTCTYGDAYEAATRVYVFPAAFANLNLSGTGAGVAVGKFSGSAEGNPLFECAYPAVFSRPVAVPEGGLLKVVAVSDSGSVGAGASTITKRIPVDAGEGWTPIGVVGFRSGSSWCAVYRAQLDGGSVEISARYNGSSSGTSVALYADVLCLRTSID